MTTPNIKTVSVREARERSSLGRTKLFELMREGRLRSVRLGRRRLIDLESLNVLLLEGDQ